MGMTSGPRARVASAALALGTNTRVMPALLAASTIGCTPESAMTASRMGRSKWVPAFFRLAGARFTVMRLTGNFMPLLFTAARIRSRASFTAASGRPTMSKPGIPLEIKASAVTTLP